MLGKYKKDTDFYYDNALISHSYGEHNYEKCILITSMIIVFAVCYLYIYFLNFSLLKICILSFQILLDLIALCFYSYVLINLKKNEIFQRVSLKNYSMVEIVIFVNYLGKIFFIFLVFFDSNFYFFWPIFSLIIKMALDTYFSLISLKIFMHSNCMIKVREFFERLAATIKYYILCCEKDEPDLQDYTKLEELESFY